jgi:lipopolysaccharide export LptBFGC system permease protein LptF
LRLQRYLAAVTLPRAGGALLLICLVYGSIDLVEAGSLTEVEAGELLLAYPAKLPAIAAQMLPLALLFGVLLAVSSLRRGGEWDALRSAGLSPVRLSPGLLAIPLLGTVLAVPLVEWLGPRGIEHYQASVGWGSSGEEERGRWTVSAGGSLVRLDGGGAPQISIGRDADGRVVEYRIAGARVWRRGAGWSSEAASIASPSDPGQAGAASAGLGQPAGAELTRADLERIVDDLERSGQDASALVSQGALRIALIAACLLVPLLGLLLAFGWNEGRASRLIALGLAVGAAYWLAVATAWNGAVLGAWSALWISAGVPVAFAVLSLLAGVRAVRGHAARSSAG